MPEPKMNSEAAENLSARQEESTGFVYIAPAIAALGGLLFGYDTGVISGALIFVQKSFALSTFHQELVVSVVLVGAAVGSLGGGNLADHIGRKTNLLITSVIFILGAIICAAAVSEIALIVGRTIVGLGIGLASSTVPLYISEVSPAKARGWQVSLFQLAITIGILAAYLVDYAFAQSEQWRWMLGLGMLYMPETPRWLVKNGQIEKAVGVLKKIRGTQNVEAEFKEIQGTLSKTDERGRWSDLLKASIRPALIVGIGLAVFQQVTGINTVIYYAPQIIRSAGISSASGAILATAGIGLVNVIMTLVSMWLIDRAGRRPLLLTGIAGMVISLGVLGFIFRESATAHDAAFGQLAVITLMAYVACFAISLGPIFWLIIAEIYPLKTRGLAEGTAASSNWAANFIVSLTFLTLVQEFGPTWTFWLYGVLAIAAWIFSSSLVPETKGRTLEEIEAFWRSRQLLKK